MERRKGKEEREGEGKGRGRGEKNWCVQLCRPKDRNKCTGNWPGRESYRDRDRTQMRKRKRGRRERTGETMRWRRVAVKKKLMKSKLIQRSMYWTDLDSTVNHYITYIVGLNEKKTNQSKSPL